MGNNSAIYEQKVNQIILQTFYLAAHSSKHCITGIIESAHLSAHYLTTLQRETVYYTDIMFSDKKNSNKAGFLDPGRDFTQEECCTWNSNLEYNAPRSCGFYHT